MDVKYIKPQIFEPFTTVIAAQSTRLGGVSEAPFESLNLSFRVGDAEANVLENRKRFFGSLGVTISEVAASKQIHEDKVLYALEPGEYEGFDAMVTDQKNIFLSVSIADCTPILIYDAANEVVAAIHAGWRGTVEGIVYKTLETIQDYFGTSPESCYAFIGACIDACSYEVDADVADNFPDFLKQFDAGKNKYLVDLKNANRDQLLEFGIPESQIEISAFSTYLHNERFFSHRKEQGNTGRMMAFIGIRN